MTARFNCPFQLEATALSPWPWLVRLN